MAEENTIGNAQSHHDEHNKNDDTRVLSNQNLMDHENTMTKQEAMAMVQSALTQYRLGMEEMINQRLVSRTREINNFNHQGMIGNKVQETEDHDKKNNEVPKENKPHVSFIEFKKCGAGAFDGTLDPIKAKYWIQETEKVFRISKCKREDMVKYATEMLVKDALDWWSNTCGAMTKADRNNLTWEIFKDKFLFHFCPSDLQRRHIREFMELKQGPMTVIKYVSEFNQKLKFVANYLNSESKKIDRFIYGLRTDIQEYLFGQEFATLEWAVNQARIREHMLQRIEIEEMPPLKKTRTVNCYCCGKTGHIANHCTMKKKCCYECGATEHLRKDCPRLNQGGGQVSASRTSGRVTTGISLTK